MQKQINKLQLFVTEDCNLRCDYCYIKKRPSNMSWETAQKAIDFWVGSYEKNNWMILDFFGGEPLLRLDFIKKIIKYVNRICKSKNIPVSFLSFTNGTLINQKLISFLKENPNFFIQISCDGIKEAHDAHRKDLSGKGTFATLEKVFKLLQQDLPHNRVIPIHAVTSPKNVQYLHQSYEYFANNYANTFSYQYNFAYDMKWTNQNFTTFEKQIALIIESEKKKLLNNEKVLDKIIANIVRRIGDGDNKRYICQMGRKKGLTVNSNGNIFLCHRFESLKNNLNYKSSDFCLGNIKDVNKLDWEKWQEKKLEFKKMMQKNEYLNCHKCKNKQYCTWLKCIWNNYFINKDFFKLNTNICKTLDHFLRPTLKFYDWLKKQNLLDQYLADFGFLPPEKRPVHFVRRDLRK